MSMDEITRIAHRCGVVAVIDGREVWADASGGMVKKLMIAAAEAEREACAMVCDEMVDWPLERHPCATITDSPQYLIGIRRGLVNATNAIRMRSNVEDDPGRPVKPHRYRAAGIGWGSHDD